MKFRQSLFWDTDPKKIDQKKNAQYIIERILDLGNDDEVRWMNKNYSVKQIKRVVNESRCLHDKTRNLWQIVLN